MRAQCASCGESFDATRRTAKFCSGRCRKRAADARARNGQVIPMRERAATAAQARPALEPMDGPGPIEAGLIAAYKEADLASPAGLIAARIARDVDRMQPGIPGYAAVLAQLRAAVDDLKSQAKPKQATPLTLLRERRAADRAAETG